ncbi:DNA gyrase inhibitor YacG [Sphingomonas radiodurans]|uniref:DNA gyrase inhibitor YacG n=1 Tax=Sphingomonas radiodurans TaxID=2890321 RepID=UPI0038CD796D
MVAQGRRVMITTCPLCAQPANRTHAPFCSPRCRDRDLLQWLSDGYLIPGPPLDPDGLDSRPVAD